MTDYEHVLAGALEPGERCYFLRAAAAADGVIGVAHARIRFQGNGSFDSKRCNRAHVRVPSQIIIISRRLGCGSDFRFFVSAVALGTAVVLPDATGSAQTLP